MYTHREIKILNRLKHRNIVNLIETFEDLEKQKLYPTIRTSLPLLLYNNGREGVEGVGVWWAEEYVVCEIVIILVLFMLWVVI